MNISWRRLFGPVGLAALAATVGCSSSAGGYCAAHADCEREFFGVIIPDEAGNENDDIAVCTANKQGQLNALRANEEDECHFYADALDIYFGCIASEFANDDDGCKVLDGECDDELDDVNDALKDIDGNECGSNEG